MQASENADLLNRFLSQSANFDVADISMPYLKYLVGRNILQTIPVEKFKNWDATYVLFSKGEYPDGRKASNQGISPYTVLFATDATGSKLAGAPTPFLTGVPTTTNADTLGIRPDLVGRPVNQLGGPDRPGVQGQVGAAGQPDDRRDRRRHGARGARRHPVRQQGQHDEGRDRQDGRDHEDIKRSGQFRSFWGSFDQSVNLMASGEVVIQSMWSPAVTAVRTRGIPCTFQPLKEGYRGWGYNFGMMKHLSGMKLDAAYEYLNWYTSGFAGAFVAREGYYAGQPANARSTSAPTSGITGMAASPPRRTSTTRSAS